MVGLSSPPVITGLTQFELFLLGVTLAYHCGTDTITPAPTSLIFFLWAFDAYVSAKDDGDIM